MDALLKCFDLGPAEVDERLAPVLRDVPSLELRLSSSFPELHVTLHAASSEALIAALALARSRLGLHVFSERADESFAGALVRMLEQRGESLATAESCTGGLMSDMLTDVAGASAVFVGGVCAYAYATKTDLLEVSNEVLTREGAVSSATVLAMAAGARRRFGSTWAVAVSGIAGPGGGSLDKPVGTVWLAVVGPRVEKTRLLHLGFDRRGNKVASAYAGLDLVRRALLGDAA